MSDYCKKCGECCRICYLTAKAGAVILDVYCPAWDPQTRLCDIYEERFRLLPFFQPGGRCLTISQMFLVNRAPRKCAYAPEWYRAGKHGIEYDPSRVNLVHPKQLRAIQEDTKKQRKRIIEYTAGRPKFSQEP